MTSAPPTRLLIFGAGGHARVVADAALGQGPWASLSGSDRDAAKCVGQLMPGIDLIEPSNAMAWDGAIHVAIGHNASREREAHTLGMQRLATVTHRAAVVSAMASLGPGCFVAATAVVAPQASLGAGVIVNHGAVIDHDTVVGEFSHVAPGAVLCGDVRLGRRVLVGAGAVVLPGGRVGDDIVVGAGSVVDRALEEPGTYAGTPARRLK
ncbi:MAG: NeuD/PglB/VioB family sugar acetyltransferase [Ramlibacter sp.]|nr:NeuD/PglB/VioB family sugar acetyltransferase [Ramlibacter sp.]